MDRTGEILRVIFLQKNEFNYNSPGLWYVFKNNENDVYASGTMFSMWAMYAWDVVTGMCSRRGRGGGHGGGHDVRRWWDSVGMCGHVCQGCDR